MRGKGNLEKLLKIEQFSNIQEKKYNFQSNKTFTNEELKIYRKKRTNIMKNKIKNYKLLKSIQTSNLVEENSSEDLDSHTKYLLCTI